MPTWDGAARHPAPTWEPAALAQWAAPGGPLHATGTLAELCESAPAVTDPGSLGRAGGEVAARIAELESLGGGPGDVVAWQLPNCADSVAMYRACWELGATAAPLHHLAGPAEVEAMLSGLGCSVLLDPHRQPQSRLQRLAERRHGSGGVSAPVGRGPSESSISSESDIAVVLHTSGSSGSPKGVMHTHRALAYKARTMAAIQGLSLIHISEPTRRRDSSRMPSSA